MVWKILSMFNYIFRSFSDLFLFFDLRHLFEDFGHKQVSLKKGIRGTLWIIVFNNLSKNQTFSGFFLDFWTNYKSESILFKPFNCWNSIYTWSLNLLTEKQLILTYARPACPNILSWQNVEKRTWKTTYALFVQACHFIAAILIHFSIRLSSRRAPLYSWLLLNLLWHFRIVKRR